MNKNKRTKEMKEFQWSKNGIRIFRRIGDDDDGLNLGIFQKKSKQNKKIIPEPSQQQC